MKMLRLLPFMLLLSAAILSCAPGKKSNGHAILSKPGKTIIVDVRTTDEWNNDGHAECAINYPLDELGTKIETLKAYEKVIVVCRSGNRAEKAKEMLEKNGIREVENKGAWQNIDCKK